MSASAPDDAQDNARSRKRQCPPIPNWKDRPSFLDASASISASTFGARRLVELNQLYNAVNTKPLQPEHVAFQSGGGQTSSRHLRRRITSHQSRRHRHRFPTGAPVASPGTKSNTRKARRSSKSSLCQGHYDWHQKDPQNSEQSTSESRNDNKTPPMNWMMTHLWHAKRFHMASLWGWRVPIAHTNRGARAVLRLTSERRSSLDRPLCTLQDLTYCRQPVTISSTKDCTLQNFVQCVARILPSWATDPNIMATSRNDSRPTEHMGEGLLHSLDQFPRGAIGPVWWQMIQTESPKTTTGQWTLRILLHPSIRLEAKKCLNELLAACAPALQQHREADDTKKDATWCCFRIGGRDATAIIQNTLKPGSYPRRLRGDCNLEEVPGEGPVVPGLVDSSEHGSILRVLFCTKTDTGNNDISPPSLPVPALLVRQMPRPWTCEANRAVAGWDLYCNPEHAFAVWMPLALSCVVIGMVEQSHLQLECEPPIPVFPRDYIDTAQSMEYWASHTCEEENASWTLVRKVQEGGWGRLPIQKQVRLPRVSWKNLMESDERNDEVNSSGRENAEEPTDLVVVRGSFGQPFLASVEGCGSMVVPSDDSKEAGSSHRKRRRSGNPFAVKRAQMLGSGQLSAWQQMVKTLGNHLSLPAVLQAHVRLVSKGTIQAGDEILLGGSFIGYATSGNFSPSRGLSHGLAFLRAATILEELSSTNGATFGRIVRLLDGKLSMQLAASVRCGHGSRNFDATISLIL